jgi:hypothetical protein
VAGFFSLLGSVLPATPLPSSFSLRPLRMAG